LRGRRVLEARNSSNCESGAVAADRCFVNPAVESASSPDAVTFHSLAFIVFLGDEPPASLLQSVFWLYLRKIKAE
jgi:hypothetical protein